MLKKIPITNTITLPASEIDLCPVHSRGSGGQRVNNVATGIHLRFDIKTSSLPLPCKDRLLAMRDHRLSKDGVIVIKADRYRNQEQNREDAVNRLTALIRSNLHTPKKRKTTKPGKKARQRRLDKKKNRGQVKALRQRIR